MEKIPSPKLINKLRDLKKFFIALTNRHHSNQAKSISADTKTNSEEEAITPTSPPTDKTSPEINETLTPTEIVSNILSLLAKGKTKEALRIHQINKQNRKASKSRFLNALAHADRNHRKLLWASSFYDDTCHKTNYIQEPRAHFAPFQYWSQGSLPSDLENIKKIWDKIFLGIGLPAIRTFNKSSARAWINFYTPEFLKLFEEAPLYAVEADIFRIAFALHNDCIWVDSDQYPRKNTGQLIQQRVDDCDTLLMFRWNRPWITNSFFLTKKASPLFQNIFNASLGYEFPTSGKMTRNDVLRSFGPGRYNIALNRILKEKTIRANNDTNYSPKSQWTSNDGWRYTFLNEKNLCALKPPFKLSYESTKDSWHNHMK